MATIRCSVESCHFYGEGDYCTANEIYVKNRTNGSNAGLGRDDMEIGNADLAKITSETCCETFKPKGSKKY